jgi:isocitrate/isopropylmalate dehydrogenase
MYPTHGALPDLSTWLINTLNTIQSAGMDQKMVVSMAEEQGFKAATVKRKISKLIEEETIRTDNVKRNRRLWYHPYFNEIPY